MPNGDGRLNLERGGQLQAERVFINPDRVRVQDSGLQGFLSQISSLSGTLGGVLADRENRRLAEQKQTDTESALLAVENNPEFQRRLATGELKETDSKTFSSRFNGFAAQKAANESAAGFKAFDVTTVQDESEIDDFVAAQRAAALSTNTSLGFQGAVSGALNDQEVGLRARRNEHLRNQQIEQTYLNFQATTADSIAEAAETGRGPEISEIINRRIDIGIEGGLSLSKVLSSVGEAAITAVTKDPDLFDELVSTPIPQVGPDASLGSLFGGELSTAQAREISRRRAEFRAAVTAQNQAAVAQARADRRRAAREIAQGGSVSDEARTALFQSDPEFALKLPKLIVDTQAAVEAADPVVRKLETDLVLGRDGINQASVDAALESGALTSLGVYDRLTTRAAEASRRGNLTTKPDFQRTFSGVSRTITSLRSTLELSNTRDLITQKRVREPLSVAASIAAQDAQVRVEEAFQDLSADLIANGMPEADAFAQAAADARDLAALEFDAVAQRFGIGERAADPLDDAPKTKNRVRPPDPRLQLEAALTLNGAGTEALVLMGGIHAIADPRLDAPVDEAITAFLDNGGVVTPWAAGRFAAFIREHPEMEGMPYSEFLHALQFSAMGR